MYSHIHDYRVFIYMYTYYTFMYTHIYNDIVIYNCYGRKSFLRKASDTLLTLTRIPCQLLEAIIHLWSAATWW